MNGPQHYRAAERLLERCVDQAISSGQAAAMVEMAQVHATLALAAATAEDWVQVYIGDESTGPRDWAGVLS